MANARKIFSLALILALHLFLLIKTKFTLWPEMVVYPYLANNNFKLYTDIINPYPPLMTWFLMMFSKMFGYEPLPYLIFTWIIIIFIDLLIYKITKSLLATIFFAFLSIPFGANGLWFDLVQTPFILVSTLYLMAFLENPKNTSNFYKLSATLALVFFIKQLAVWLIITALAIIFLKLGKSTKDVFLKNPAILAPFIILLALQIFIFARQESLADYFFWVFAFPILLASQMPGYFDLPKVSQSIVILALLIPFFLLTFKKNHKIQVPISFAALSVLFIFPRFDFFHLIPSLALFSLAIPRLIEELKSKFFLVIFTVSFIVVLIFAIRSYIKNWGHEVRFFEKEIYQTAGILREINPPGKPIYIQNGPDQIFPIASLLPPKPWADEFPWYLELPNVQDRIVEGIKLNPPRFIVFKPYELKEPYEIGSYRPLKINQFITTNYQNFFQISDTLWLKIKK